MSAPSHLIYKIAGREAWRAAEQAGRFVGSADDLRDGYIHFSTASQLAGTLAKFYAGRDDLILAAVASERLGDALRWEAARGDALFPHLYRALTMAEIAWVRPLPLGRDGSHDLPEGVL